jgi:hypothetical protein
MLSKVIDLHIVNIKKMNVESRVQITDIAESGKNILRNFLCVIIHTYCDNPREINSKGAHKLFKD